MFFEKSLEIILSEQLPEPASAEAVVVPLSPSESIVAARGLSRHIDVLYKGVLRNSDPDRALLGIYEFIDTDIEEYRTRAKNLAISLNPDRCQKGHRSVAALAISYLVVGQELHRTGVWPDAKTQDDFHKEKFKEVMTSDELTFYELNEWAIKQTVLNDRFWRQELQGARTHPRIIELREAIETSDHSLEV